MSFSFRKSGTTGCEIIDADGSVIAWTVDVAWAGLIVAGLEWLVTEAQPPRCHFPSGTGAIEPTDRCLV